MAARVTKNAPIFTAGVLSLLLKRFEKRTHLPESDRLRHDHVKGRISPRGSLQGVHTVHSFNYAEWALLIDVGKLATGAFGNLLHHVVCKPKLTRLPQQT